MNKITRRHEELAFLIGIAVLGLAALIGGLGYGLEAEDRVGPGLVPFVAGLLVIVPVLGRLVRVLRSGPGTTLDENPGRTSVTEARESIPDSDAEVDDHPKPPHGAVIFGLIALSVAATFLIGMLLSVSLLVGVLFLLNDRRRPVTALVAAVAAGVFGWGVFETALDVPLPAGLLGLV